MATLTIPITIEQIRELAGEHTNLTAVKESSTDVRRVSAIRAVLDQRLEICVGVDDAVLEAIGVGATGWVAGLANALPRESVDLFNAGMKRSEVVFESTVSRLSSASLTRIWRKNGRFIEATRSMERHNAPSNPVSMTHSCSTSGKRGGRKVTLTRAC